MIKSKYLKQNEDEQYVKKRKKEKKSRLKLKNSEDLCYESSLCKESRLKHSWI